MPPKTAFLLAEAIDKLVVIEPAANLIPILSERLAPWGEKVMLVSSSLEDAVHTLRGQPVDTVISLNVLEHIPDDRRTLRTMWEILPEGGRVILLVPALPGLYGSLDRAFEHVRRYRRQELHEKVSAAGFQILRTSFMNFPGILAWLVTGQILRRRTLDPWAVKLYDRYAIPRNAREVSPPTNGPESPADRRKAPESRMITPQLSIIIPAYNEAATAAEIIQRVFTLPLNLSMELIIVDDASTDGTPKVREKVLAEQPDGMRVVCRTVNRGKGCRYSK